MEDSSRNLGIGLPLCSALFIEETYFHHCPCQRPDHPGGPDAADPLLRRRGRRGDQGLPLGAILAGQPRPLQEPPHAQKFLLQRGKYGLSLLHLQLGPTELYSSDVDATWSFLCR